MPTRQRTATDLASHWGPDRRFARGDALLMAVAGRHGVAGWLRARRGS